MAIEERWLMEHAAENSTSLDTILHEHQASRGVAYCYEAKKKVIAHATLLLASKTGRAAAGEIPTFVVRELHGIQASMFY